MLNGLEALTSRFGAKLISDVLQKPLGRNLSAETFLFCLFVNEVGDRRKLNTASGHVVEERDLGVICPRRRPSGHEVGQRRVFFRFVGVEVLKVSELGLRQASIFLLDSRHDVPLRALIEVTDDHVETVENPVLQFAGQNGTYMQTRP